MQETRVWFLGQEDPLEKEMAIQSSTLAWEIPWMEEPDRLHSMGSQTVGHDWATSDSDSDTICNLDAYLFFMSVQFSRSVVSDSLQPHGLQHAWPPCPSPTSGVYSNSCPLSWWCRPAISSSAISFSSCLQSFPSSGSFPVSQFFTSGSQSSGVSFSASVLPVNIQDWFPFRWTGWISLQSKGLSRVFSNTTVQKHQFFGAQLSL